MELLTILLRMAVHFRTRVEPLAHCAIGLAALSLVPLLGLAAAAENETLENTVKAAYLAKFGLYVDWPTTAFAAPSSVFNLCIAGEDPFGATLDKAVAEQRVGNRPIVVVRLKTVGRDSGCHILYLGGSDRLTAQILAAARSSGVLSVGDARGPATPAAIINFVIKDNRVRFDIDEEAAAQNGLTISSKLLNLALNVKRKKSEETR